MTHRPRKTPRQAAQMPREIERLFLVRSATPTGTRTAAFLHAGHAYAFADKLAARDDVVCRVWVIQGPLHPQSMIDPVPVVSLGDSAEVRDTSGDAESVGSREGSPVDGLPVPPADPAHEVRAERLPTPSFVTR